MEQYPAVREQAWQSSGKVDRELPRATGGRQRNNRSMSTVSSPVAGTGESDSGL